MSDHSTLTDRLFARIRNNPIAASVIVLASLVTGLATFTGAVHHLLGLFGGDPTAEARRELGRLSLGYTADEFVKAAEKNDLHAVKLYLAAGMDPDIKASTASTALVEAVRGGHVSVVQELLAHKAPFAGYVLTRAATQESGEILRILLEAGAATDMKNEAFLFAASTGRLANMRVLVTAGAELSSIGAEALRRAAGSRFNGDKTSDAVKREIVDYLFELGVHPTVPDKRGLSALHYSARNGFVAVTQILLQNGAKANARGNNGHTPLFEALSLHNSYPPDEKCEPIVKLLLAGGADVNASDSEGKTPLMVAANFRKAKIVRMLLEAGARADAEDSRGRTALSFVPYNIGPNRRDEQDEIIRLLRSALSRTDSAKKLAAQ